MVIQRNWKNASNSPTNQDSNQQPAQATTPHHSASSDDSSSSWKTVPMQSSSDSAIGAAGSGIKMSATGDTNGSWGDADESTTVRSQSKDASVTTVTATVKSHISNPQMAESVHRALKERYSGSLSQQHQNNAAIRSIELMRGCVQDMFNEELDAIVRRYVDNYFKPALKNISDNLGEDVISSSDCIQSISHALVDTARLQYARIEVTPSVMPVNAGRPLNQRHANAVKRKIEPPTGGGSVRSAVRRPSLTTAVASKPAALAGKLHVHTNATAGGAAAPFAQWSPGGVGQPGRTKQVFWNVSQLNAHTLFVLDFRANQALGFGEQGKERLASRHPELIRYLPDALDKGWLHEQRIITAAHRSNRFLLLVHAEVERVAHSDAYLGTAERATVAMSLLHGFRVPDFMLQKMKVFFTELSLRSQSVVANGGAMVAPASTQQQQQPEQQEPEPEPERQQSPNQQLQQVINHQPPNVRPQRSSLSSSHATLSALLSNSTSTAASVATGGPAATTTTTIESAKMSSDRKK